ncbi:MAG: hypothetical protein LBS98_01615, partial [Coriobacteriales bacterium]|nr:hypothetical protein [Coriobacteriales bacterium]
KSDISIPAERIILSKGAGFDRGGCRRLKALETVKWTIARPKNLYFQVLFYSDAPNGLGVLFCESARLIDG